MLTAKQESATLSERAMTVAQPAPVFAAAAKPPLWLLRTTLLWNNRRLLARITGIALVAGLGIAFAIPKQYQSVARIMPPDQQGTGAMVLASLASRAGGLGSLAGGLLSGRLSTSALFIDLLRSGTVAGHLIERFKLQKVYHTRYQVDTAKRLARCTTIVEDKKSGVISITVEDTDPTRARDITAAYLEELNKIVTQTNNSTAHQERIFIERRLQAVEKDLERSQLDLSDFSSRNSTVDIKEQARSMLEAAARIQSEMLVAESSLNSLRQLYGDGNVRVREAEARIATLQQELTKMNRPSGATGSDGSNTASGSSELYPVLRQLPRLAVPYADLYRKVKVQETVYELLTQQYEVARIDEAKDIPVVSVIDPPGIPEKKSFPPRLIVALLLTLFSFVIASLFLLVRDLWESLPAADPRKLLGQEIASTLRPLRNRGGGA